MASVTYKVKGSYDNSALKKAKSGLSSFMGGIKSFNVAIAAGAYVGQKAIQAVNKVVQGSAETFIAQNKALANYNKSIQNNFNMTSSGAERLSAAMKQMSRNNFFDADSLNNASAFLNNMKLNEKQIKDVMEAATEMASAGIMPLDQAVKTLSLSYSGNIKQMSKLIPDLKDLTKEELENGKAVDIVKKQYEGYADAMSKTFSGRKTQYNNTFSDLQASIGGVIASVQYQSQGMMLKPMQELTTMIETFRNQIISAIINIPEIFWQSLLTMKAMIDKTFTGAGLLNVLKLIGNNILSELKFVFDKTWIVILTNSKQIFNFWFFIIDNIVTAMLNGVVKVANSIIDKINSIGANLPDWFKSLFNITDTKLIKIKFVNERPEATSFDDYLAKARINIEDMMKGFGDSYIQYVERNFQNAEDFAKLYGEENEDFMKKLKAILLKDLPEDLKKALDAKTGTTSTGTTEATEKTVNILEEGQKSLTSSMGQMSSVIQGFSSGGMMGGVIAILIKAIASIVSAAANASESVQKLLNVFDTLFGAMFEKTGKTLENTFQPFVEGISTIGEILGDILGPAMALVNTVFGPLNKLGNQILKVIEPIFEGVFKIINALASLEPLMIIVGKILEGITWIFGKLANVIIGFFNSIFSVINKAISAINKLPGVNISKISMIGSAVDDTDSWNTSDTSLSSSASASYTAARDIYLNVYYDHSFVNGDAQEIAIAIRDEIKRAERLGY